MATVVSFTLLHPDLLTGNRINRPSLQGSVFWMAPEVVKQTGHTRKADIWSVGCLVVEMLTGEHPWAQLTQMQAIFKVRIYKSPHFRCAQTPHRLDPRQGQRFLQIYHLMLKTFYVKHLKLTMKQDPLQQSCYNIHGLSQLAPT